MIGMISIPAKIDCQAARNDALSNDYAYMVACGRPQQNEQEVLSLIFSAVYQLSLIGADEEPELCIM